MTASPTFSYKVKDRSGKVQEGEMQGSSTAAVVKTLKDRGLIPLAVDQKAASVGLKKEIKIPGFTDRVKLKDLAIFSRQFATMVNSGLSLIRALSVLEGQTENKALAAIVGQVRKSVEEGASLSQALEKHPKVFNHLFVAMVKAGEAGGVLDETLERLADIIEKSVALRSKVKSAMAYPVVVSGLVVIIVSAMLLFVVPMFEKMYSDLGGNLPLPTTLLINTSKILQSLWWVLGLITIGAVIALKRWKKTPAGRLSFDHFKLRVPVFGNLTHKASIARFSRTFSVLTRTGVPILQAIDIVGETTGNAVLTKALGEVKTSVKEGESLTKPLVKHSVFPPMVVQMMAVGEETGELDTMLTKVADFYESEVNATVDALTSLIEPILIVVMGATVGGILIAMYLPMFNVANLIQ